MQDESSSEFIDAFCDAFEQAWLAGQVPELKEWLNRADASVRPLLLPELLRVDLEYRLKNGHCGFIIDEYVRKFGLEPADISLLKASLLSSVPGGNDETLEADTVALPEANGVSTPRSVDSVLSEIGSYEVLEEIGRGGMGVVYRARHRTLGRLVALKTLPTYGAVDADTLARFRAEAEAAAHLDHPGIVPIYEIGEDRGLPWFTMGLVEGRTLRQRIRDEPFRPRDAAEVVAQIADALVYAHGRGVIHRDIKPSNVMVAADGSVKLTDFGLARLATRDVSLTATNEVIGTASYMSPEQAAGRASAVTETADVYSVGAVLYCCLTGRPPFSGSSTKLMNFMAFS
jgi:serine/threonine-protein kinase